MRVLLAIDFVLCAVAYAACIVDDIRRRRWRTPVGRQLLAASAVLLAENLSFAVLTTGVAPVRPWVFMVAFTAAAGVAVSWVWLRWRSRREVA